MSHTPLQISAGAALLGLGGLGGVLLSGEAEHRLAASATAPVEVRTQVVRRTIRVVRHERPRHPARALVPPASRTPSLASPPVPGAAATPPVAARPAPLRTGASRTQAPARKVTAPLRTRASSTGRGREHDDGQGHGDD